MPYIFEHKGMHMHPFSDQSGVAFYRPDTTVITSIGLPLKEIERILEHPSFDDPQHVKVIDELLANGFIKEVMDK